MNHAHRFLLAVVALSIATLLAGSPSTAVAAQGDCGQPVTNGSGPLATDCLFILRAAVSLETCSPVCICDPNASGGNPNATDSLTCLNVAVGTPGVELDCGPGCNATTTTTTGGGTTTTTTGGGTTTTTTGGGSTTTTTGGGTTTTTTGGGGGACPDLIDLTIFAGAGIECSSNNDCEVGTCDTGIGRCDTVTSLDTGWTGISHDADVNDQQQALANLDCSASGAPCGVCDVTGINPDNRVCRCANDNQAICDQPFVADADDCGGAVCNCYLGPPLPLSAGLTPACVVNRLANDVTGTVDVDTGTAATTVNLRSIVFLGVNVFTPCPYCDGDTTVGDGARDGTCVEGPNDGDACDADALNTTFPWTQTTIGNGTSLDCFPDNGVNVSGQGLQIDLPLSTGTQQLDPQVPCGLLPFVQETCTCGECSNNDDIPCTSNSDCTGGASCLTIGQDGRPDQCAGGGVCNDAGGGEGVCAEGPNTLFCDAALRASGVPFISCINNNDCNAYPGSGVCSIQLGRECFLPTIVATGDPDPDFPIGVSTFCIVKTSNGGINSVAGLPGPGRVVNQGKTVKYCGGINGSVYTPNVGCP